MKKMTRWFDEMVFKELDDIWETYSIKSRPIINWKRKAMHKVWPCYNYDALVERTKTDDSSNPIMHLIYQTLSLEYETYYPIYKRKKNIKIRAKKWLAFLCDAYYNKNLKNWEYTDNIIDHTKDEIFCWYPPIVTRLYCNDITDNDWNNVLVSLIKRRHANKKTS